MDLSTATVLVTGANRGLGAEFVRQLRDRGARRIYATARRAASVQAEGFDGVEVIELDVTDAEQIAAAARIAGDVDFLINNAGIALGGSLLEGSTDGLRQELEVNLFGPLAMARAFAPVLVANGGGAVLNVLSAAGWLTAPGATTYATSKAAAWSMTDGLRLELAAQGTQVTSLQMALVDTGMTEHLTVPKERPDVIVSRALNGVEAGAHEVLGDELTRTVKASLALDPAERYAASIPTP